MVAQREAAIAAKESDLSHVRAQVMEEREELAEHNDKVWFQHVDQVAVLLVSV